MTLSVCLIVKDEEQYLEGCLQSVQPVADEILVTDTGSTDRTVAIAEQYATVQQIAWPHDFAKARNISMRDAQGDWILILDADERLMSESIEPLQDLLVSHESPIGYHINIKSYRSDGSVTTSGNYRLFTNGYGIQYKGKIHEGVWDSLVNDLKGEPVQSCVWLEHYGYQDESKQAAKRQRNLELMSQVLDENPSDHYIRFTLAHQQCLEHDPATAAKNFQRVIDEAEFAGSLLISAYNGLADCYIELGYFGKALKAVKESLKISAYQVGAHWNAYRIFWHEEEWVQAKEALLHVATVQDWLKSNAPIASTDIQIPYQELREYYQAAESKVLAHAKPGTTIIQPSGQQYIIQPNGEWKAV